MKPTKEQIALAGKIARACEKQGTSGYEGNVVEADENEDFPISIGGDELTIHFENDRIVAFSLWNYDATWFGVVDLQSEELVMSSCASDFVDKDAQLVIYRERTAI